MDMKTLEIIGCGPGAREYLTLAALDAARGCEVLMGSSRLLELFSEPVEKVVLSATGSEAIAAIEARPEQHIGVLVSGDPGMSSLATPLLRHFGLSRCRIVPGISSVQIAASVLGVDWCNARILSAHGADPKVEVEKLGNERRLIILGGRSQSLAWIADTAGRLGGAWRCWVLEDLSLPDQRIQKVPLEELAAFRGSSLLVVVLEKE